MPVAIKGSGGGSVTLDAGAAAADTTLTLPNTSGTILQSGTAVTAAQGGTGLTSPGTAGNVLTSTGSAWASSAPTATGVNVQTFTSSGTWTKPAYAAGSRVLVQCWGAGGSGGKSTGAGGGSGGGAGGGYNERWLTLSQMAATETATVGAGGTAVSAVGNGNVGGTTSLGSLVYAYGGGGGGGSASVGTFSTNGSGGGQLSAGATANAYNVGKPIFITNGPNELSQGSGGFANSSQFTPTLCSAFFHGGGGGYAGAQGTPDGSLWGGGGGGASATNTAGGTSQYAGNGGAGGATGTAGTQPAGGGGGSTSGNSGAGAAGQIIVTVFPA